MNRADKLARATHAYIGVYDGVCKAVTVDVGDKYTSEFVLDIIKGGGVIHHVSLDIARNALNKPFPTPGAEIQE